MRGKRTLGAAAALSPSASQADSSSPTLASDGPESEPMWGSDPASRRAARSRPASPSPRTASHRSPDGVTSVATVGGCAAPGSLSSPGGNGGSARKSATASPAASTARSPIRMPIWPGPRSAPQRQVEGHGLEPQPGRDLGGGGPLGAGGVGRED